MVREAVHPDFVCDTYFKCYSLSCDIGKEVNDRIKLAITRHFTKLYSQHGTFILQDSQREFYEFVPGKYFCGSRIFSDKMQFLRNFDGDV